MEKFWMIFLEGQNPPKFIHTTKISAEAEAERLAREFNRRAYILQVISMVHLKPAEIITDTLPF